MMMRYQARMHPTLDILCDTLGRVFLPGDTWHKARWTYGSTGSKGGYLRVRFNGKTYLVHVLICQTFHGLAPEEGLTVDHIDRCTTRNVPFNLRWLDKHGQMANRQIAINCIKKIGFRKIDDPNGYRRVRRKVDPEYRERCRSFGKATYYKNRQDPEWLESERERNRGRYYKKMAENKEEALRRYNDYEEKQRALGRVRRRCPDGKRKWLTREEFFEEYGYWPKK
jgi:hypothetical protein